MGDKNYHCRCLGECDWIASWWSEKKKRDVTITQTQDNWEAMWELYGIYISHFGVKWNVRVGNVTSIVGWKDLTHLGVDKIFNVYVKALQKKAPPLTHVTSKCLLKGKIQNWASSTLRGTTLASLLPPTSTPVTKTDRKCGAAAPPIPSSRVPFIHRHRGAEVVTCYCCYLCEASTDKHDGAEICSFSCMKGNRPLLWHKLASTSTTCLTEPAGLQQCRQAVSRWSDPQWITGNWPQASLLPGCNS